MSALFKITYGLYLVAVKGEKHTGCIANTLMQQSNDKVSVALNKANLTHEILMKTKRTTVSILDMSVEPELVKTFGMNSGRVLNKFDGGKHLLGGCVFI